MRRLPLIILMVLALATSAFAQSQSNVLSLTWKPVTFAQLTARPSQTNATAAYCSDCQSSQVCSAGGSGAPAYRIGNVWTCAPIGPAYSMFIGGSDLVLDQSVPFAVGECLGFMLEPITDIPAIGFIPCGTASPSPSPSTTLQVATFGAVGDGTTDDALPLYNASVALNSKPGQTLQFGSGKTYFVNSKPFGPWVTLNLTSNYETLDFNGATLLIGSGVTSAFMGAGWPTAYQSFTHYPVNAAVRGATSVTTTTAANAGNFTVGDLIYFAGPTQSVSHCYLGTNFVTAVNASTGEIDLQRPLGKTYPTSPFVTDGQPAAMYGLTLKNGHIRWQGTCNAQLLSMGQIVNFHMDSMDINMRNCTGTFEPIQANSMTDLLVTSSKSTAVNSAGPFEAGGLGSVNSRFVGNTAVALGLSGGIFGSLEGTESFAAIGNQIFVQGGTGVSPHLTAAISLGSTYDSVIDGNNISFGGTRPNGTVGVVQTGGQSCPTIGSNISNNIILTQNVEGILSQAADTIVGNTIESNLFGIDLKDVSGLAQLVSGNKIIDQGGSNTGIIDTNYQGAIITGNQIVGDTGVTCNIGIRIGNPGSPSAAVNVITGNSATGCTTPVTYDSRVNVPLFQVFGNGYPASNLNTPLVPPAHLATFGTCASALEGQLRTQDDSAVACVQGILAAAGGSTHCQIYCNGSIWNRTGN